MNERMNGNSILKSNGAHTIYHLNGPTKHETLLISLPVLSPLHDIPT